MRLTVQFSWKDKTTSQVEYDVKDANHGSILGMDIRDRLIQSDSNGLAWLVGPQDFLGYLVNCRELLLVTFYLK